MSNTEQSKIDVVCVGCKTRIILEICARDLSSKEADFRAYMLTIRNPFDDRFFAKVPGRTVRVGDIYKPDEQSTKKA